jgi:phosphoglycolate phosphatase-like HAD superfamily hydrolase
MTYKLLPNNYKVLLWDFDGVIINSHSIREYGFREVLKEYDNYQVQKLIHFHNLNGGWSRYVKFRYFYEEILCEPLSDDRLQYLSSKFSSIMKEYLADSKLLITSSVIFINKMFVQGKKMHIVSGSDESELQELCYRLDIAKYFQSINGSPTPKIDLVSSIISKSEFSEPDFCLIGDSINDYDAARKNNIKFFGYNNPELLECDNYIYEFK